VPGDEVSRPVEPVADQTATLAVTLPAGARWSHRSRRERRSRFQQCEPIYSGGTAGVAVLGVDGDAIQEVDRQLVDSDESVSAERAILTPDGTWL
jgi:hypothetical protein